MWWLFRHLLSDAYLWLALGTISRWLRVRVSACVRVRACVRARARAPERASAPITELLE